MSPHPDPLLAEEEGKIIKAISPCPHLLKRGENTYVTHPIPLFHKERGNNHISQSIRTTHTALFLIGRG
jgi:hypothetical protein